MPIQAYIFGHVWVIEVVYKSSSWKSKLKTKAHYELRITSVFTFSVGGIACFAVGSSPSYPDIRGECRSGLVSETQSNF